MKYFPNLARDRAEHDKEAPAVDKIIMAELEAAGIDITRLPFLVAQSEVPTYVIGRIEKSGWTFERRWTYWSASGPGVPLDFAEALHCGFGQEVRVDGHCGCPSPREWFHGFAVGRYHIDTPDGLKALANTIKAILEKEFSARPRQFQQDSTEFLPSLQIAIDTLLAISDSPSNDPAVLKKIASDCYNRLIHTPEHLAKRIGGSR